MQITNWIILKSKDRGIDYGVGTFIKQLSHGLAARKEINVFLLEIGITGSKYFSMRKQDGITIIERSHWRKIRRELIPKKDRKSCLGILPELYYSIFQNVMLQLYI